MGGAAAFCAGADAVSKQERPRQSKTERIERGMRVLQNDILAAAFKTCLFQL
jgi:Tfp pilus assembly protein PilF